MTAACRTQTQESPFNTLHYNHVIMGAIASQITSLTIIYWTVYSDADQRKHQSSASLAFVRGIHRGPVNFPHKWTVTRKMFPFDDVIMKHLWCLFVSLSWDIIGSSNGPLPVELQAITRTDLLPFATQGNVKDILFIIRTFVPKYIWKRRLQNVSHFVPVIVLNNEANLLHCHLFNFSYD